MKWKGRAETASHELLGHGVLYAKGLNPNHIFLPGGLEGNGVLKTQIIQSVDETKLNMLRGLK